MKNSLIAAAALAATLALPLAASAQTPSYQYEYVNTSGQIASIMAASATAALNTAPNLALHSGVLYIANPSDALPNTTVAL